MSKRDNLIRFSSKRSNSTLNTAAFGNYSAAPRPTREKFTVNEAHIPAEIRDKVSR